MSTASSSPSTTTGPSSATQIAGGNAPDVIQMDYRYIVEYAKRGAIAPLDEFVGKALDLDDFDEDQLEGGKVDGKLYGISSAPTRWP